MIEQILTRKNLLQAMYKVQKNHGSAGVDHMPVTKLSELETRGTDRKSSFREGICHNPFRGRNPERERETRLLGIPTVTDRLLQQAVLQVINARFEYEFSDSSLVSVQTGTRNRQF